MSARRAAAPVSLRLARSLTAMGLEAEDGRAYYAEARSVLCFGARVLAADRPLGALSLRLARVYWCAAAQLQLSPSRALHTLDRLWGLFQEADAS